MVAAVMAKRKREPNTDACSVKQLKVRHDNHGDPGIEHPALVNHYANIQSLRNYLEIWLSSRSKHSKKRLARAAAQNSELADLLDSVLVGVLDETSETLQKQRQDELDSFTQQQQANNGAPAQSSSYNFDEVIQFVIWTLFQKCSVLRRNPSHVLCHGFSRSATADSAAPAHINHIAPGITQSHPNASFQSLKSESWSLLSKVLGVHAGVVLSTVLLDHGLFQKLAGGRNNYFQLSGIPLYELSPCRPEIHVASKRKQIVHSGAGSVHTPGNIKFVRSRILYAKPSINSRGQVSAGLKHIHALNRYRDTSNRQENIKMLCYIFPRQFQLHNVFTSTVNKQETTHPFKDYSVREEEILQLLRKGKLKAPRRLRGGCLKLVQKIRQNHFRCSYSQLLRHHCSLTSTIMVNKSLADNQDHEKTELSFLPHATPFHRVSAFCRSVLRTILPRSVFGIGEAGNHNWSVLDIYIGHFIRMRRYETFSLHEVVNGLRLKCLTWIAPTNYVSTARMSMSDKSKREELLYEFVYYIFDSLLIPLLRSHFYITESGAHRNQLFYFRHDVWRKLSEPAFVSMKFGALQPLSNKEALKACKTSVLGYNQLRLLPKDKGSRPIINLRRRAMKCAKGQMSLTNSTNALLGPLFSVMNYERQQNPGKLGSAMFSVSEIQCRLRNFLHTRSNGPKMPFYFVKVDIQSAFDTIPQSKLLACINELLENDIYRCAKYAQTKWLSNDSSRSAGHLRKRFLSNARCLDLSPALALRDAEQTVNGKKNLVISSTDNQKLWTKQGLKRLLSSHVSSNIVKIGRKHFHQLEGIPQGSVLSSLLCNLFYADFERSYLDFLDKQDSLLLRLIDDFLLITTNHSHAVRFARAMSYGSQSHGIQINIAKSLANFDIIVDETPVRKHSDSFTFPYCGLLINTTNLEVGRDRTRKDYYIGNSLTVDTHGRSGIIFRQRILTALRLQLQVLFLDPLINSRSRILQTLIECFSESAMKMHQYRSSMPVSHQPGPDLILDNIEQSTTLAVGMIRQNMQYAPYAIITQTQMKWIAAVSYAGILVPKQSQYRAVLTQLRDWKQEYEYSMGLTSQYLEEIVERSLTPFSRYMY